MMWNRDHSSNRECKREREKGFSLTELLVALLVTGLVAASVFALLRKGQDSFGRESEITDLNQSARVGLDMMNRDLLLAGFRTPPAMAVLWDDGGGVNPDEVTIVYADDKVPISQPRECGNPCGGPCKTIERSSTLNIDPTTLDPPLADPTQAYADGMVLFAIETEDCNGDGQVGAIPFEVTQPPNLNNAGGCENLQINHNPGQGDSDINRPGGFNRDVEPDCAVIGLFRVIQYRINPLPPTANPMLERRDLSLAEPWIPVSNNIENLQVHYAVGSSPNFIDVPAPPNPADPTTWITRVRVTVAGRSESKNLQGGTVGNFDADARVRKAFSTVVSLRNQMYSAAEAGFQNYH